METIELLSEHGRVRISRQGAQVLEAQLAGRDLLWVSPLLDTTPGKAMRGGVPVCFPWFGKHPEGLPAHGFARNRDWTLTGQSADHVEFELHDDEQTFALWPHRFRASLRIMLSTTLRFDLTIENCDMAPFTFSYALHSYFATKDCRNCMIEGLDGRLRREVAHVTTPQAGVVSMAKPIDAIFERVQGDLLLRGTDQVVCIAAEGMASAVVWNPGEAGAAVADIGGHWREFACVERGNVGDAAITLAAGERHVGHMSLAIV
jgi:D-hexose-6-phosphate mutarotase